MKWGDEPAQPEARVVRRAIWSLAMLTICVLVTIEACDPAGATAATPVAAGESHTCALTAAGGVRCWGWNALGQLGDGTTTDRLTAVDVTGLRTGVALVTTGGRHTCALTTGGAVKCWGWNFLGQLGDGTTVISRPNAVDATGLGSGVVAIAAGADHTCALTTAGGVKCWGENGYGQLGDGTTVDRLTAVDVSGLASGVTAIAAGGYHTCALTAGGGVKCWGQNFSGQLGDNTTTERLTAVNVVGMGGGTAGIIAGAYHTCALTAAGAVKCWGYNADGQLGDGTTTGRLTGVDVSGLGTGVTAIAAGDSHSCALTTPGAVKCWGANVRGGLGDGTTTDRVTPVDVTGLASGVTAIAAGRYHTCASTATGAVSCWGDNSKGQVGGGATPFRVTAVDVTGLASGVAAITGGGSHGCALTTAGGLRCWGTNGNGRLGDGTTTDRLTAVDVAGLGSGVASVSAGRAYTCALTIAGGAKCWGENFGQLGDGTTTDRLTAVDVTGLTSGVAAVASGVYHTCALTTAGGVKCWGDNFDGELGDGTTTRRLTAVDVVELASGATAIAVGQGHSCAVTTAGGVKCWGSNSFGQLGDGTTTDRMTPVGVLGLSSGVAAIAGGNSHTCALTTAGGVKCWGNNAYGGVGDGTRSDRVTPVDVARLTTGVTAISAGTLHTCALTTSGGVKCWGYNRVGQLGDGSRIDRPAAVDVVGLGSGVAAIAGAYDHTCTLTTSGGVKCWGDNRDGQLGNGEVGYSTAPRDVGVCGNGAVEGGEFCDAGASNGTSGSCCSAICEFAAIVKVCRDAAGTCDVAETCSGTSATCPADTLRPASTVCRDAAGTCDVAETCSGTSAMCPADALRPASTVCRAAGGACDVAEACSGTSAACPANVFVAAGTVCAASTGVCDAADLCSGSSASCPPSAPLPDKDADGVCNKGDNCADVFNPDQRDADASGKGDVCDVCPAAGNNADCDREQTAAATVMPGGGTVTVPSGEIQLSVPPATLTAPTSVSVTGGLSSSGYGLKTGDKTPLLAEFEPSGVIFNPPVTVTFRWTDRNDNCFVDDPTKTCPTETRPPGVLCGDEPASCDSALRETKLQIWRNGKEYPSPRVFCENDLIGAPSKPLGCDVKANTWTITAREFSEYVLGEATCSALGNADLEVLNLTTLAGDEKVKFRGSFNVDVPTIPALDPREGGFSVVVETAAGDVLFAEQVEGGAFSAMTKTGWKKSPERDTWTYKGKPPGVKTAKVSVLSAAEGKVKVTLLARGLELPALSAGDLPLKLRLFVDGRCGDAIYPGPAPAPRCRFSAEQSRVLCD